MDEKIYQREMMEFIKKFPNNGNVMIPIHGRTEKYGTDAYFQCRLFSLESAKKELENDNTNNWVGTSPGFTQYGFADDAETVYNRFNNQDNMEPFVIERNYNGLRKQDELEIVEEFRLLNNLFFDREKNEYVDLENEATVVKIENDFVMVDRKYLKRYLSVKGMVMLIHCDSRYTVDNLDERISEYSNTEKMENKIYTLSIGVFNRKNFSLIYAKTAIFGCPIKDCGYWPFNERKEFEDYIIGVDEDGNNKIFTSEPSKLSNYFSDNNDAPHYLTPVFFKREVLQKYYNQSDRYSIEPGILRCGTLWSLYIDNESSDYISAYLGDLGRDLPIKEQKYWKNYNIAIDGKLSKSKVMRDFLNTFSSSENPIFIFQNKYIKVNNAYDEKLGYPLFLPLHNDDEYTLNELRIPLLDSQAEFDQQVLFLVKLLIDSLNEKGITMSISPEIGISGSISKLEELFKHYGLKDYEDEIKFLRSLQGLRSSSVAHKKGGNYDRISKNFQIGELSKVEVFKQIVNRANDFLNYIESNLEKMN